MTIVHTVHRLLPRLVGYAVHEAICGDKKTKRKQLRKEYYKRVGKVEGQRLYEAIKELNIKNGIDPKKFREQHAVFNAAKKIGKYRRRSSAPVTLPKLSV